jgi:methylmalonyl-CoA/ethylmalonyl-CoA epimerase
VGKIIRIDHVAIAVASLSEAGEILSEKLGAKFLREIENKKEKYIVAYYQFGENILTILQPTSEDSFIAKHIDQKGQGLHHLGLEVEGLEDLVSELEAKGVRIPLKDLDDPERMEVVLSPKDTFGVVLQLVEWLGGSDLSLEKRMERVVRFRES